MKRKGGTYKVDQKTGETRRISGTKPKPERKPKQAKAKEDKQ